MYSQQLLLAVFVLSIYCWRTVCEFGQHVIGAYVV